MSYESSLIEIKVCVAKKIRFWIEEIKKFDCEGILILNITGGSFSKNKINSKSIENDERDNETRGGQTAPEIVRVPRQGLGGH